MNVKERLEHENKVRKRKEENLITWYAHILNTTRKNIKCCENKIELKEEEIIKSVGIIYYCC